MIFIIENCLMTWLLIELNSLVAFLSSFFSFAANQDLREFDIELNTSRW